MTLHPSVRPFAALALAAAGLTHLHAADKPDEFPPKPQTLARTGAEEAKTFQLPPGYRMELLLSDPDIKEPVAIAFDGNGRMFVSEMRSYMQDVEGKDELKPVSRVSLHWSSKGDGVIDKHTVFADKLILPRMILPLGKGQCVIGETDTNDLFLYTDTDGDGVSDKKEPWVVGGKRGGNLEHQPSGLVWAIDNAIYTSYNNFRYRWTSKGVEKEPSGNNNGQWGVGQDAHGRLYFPNAGGEAGPQSFQVPVAYGGFNPGKQFAPGYKEVFPATGVADVQGGHGRHRADGTLNNTTSAAGAEVYRGDRLPGELLGNLFFGEPVGRLVRRSTVTIKDAFVTLSNPYQEQKSEFLRSTDLCFRPLNFATAPDGTLYIVDMYRGIIQEGNWVRSDSYLRKPVVQYGLQNIVGLGRVWRLAHDTTKLGPQPHMFDETPAQLVAHLAHPNGWWRDTAQKLLVLSQDKSVVPALTQMARMHENYLARLHALWTLQGLGAVTPALVREKLKDIHPQLRVAAIRVSESLKEDAALQTEVLAMTKDPDAEVVLQTLLTARYLQIPDWKKLAGETVATSQFAGVKDIGGLLINPPSNGAPPPSFTAEQRKVLTAGEVTFKTICAVCHGPDGKGTPFAGGAVGQMMAPSMPKSKTIQGPSDGPLLVLLHGLTGEIDGKKYEGLMVSMATFDDPTIANVASYIRNSFGNRASFVTPGDVARVRATFKARTTPWTIGELRAELPQELERKGWKLTASDHPDAAKAAIDNDPGSRWDTGTSQHPGMWFQVELPQPVEIAAIQLDTSASANDYPRGYEVTLSTDGKQWSAPVAKGKGDTSITQIEFPAATAKFIRITQTGSVGGLFWSIHEMQIYAAKTQHPSASQGRTPASPPPK